MKLPIFRDISIRWKVVAIIFVVLAASLLLAGAGLWLHARADFERDASQRLTLLADVVGENAAAALVLNDPEAAAQTLAALGRYERIMAAGLYDAMGSLFARYRRDDAELPISRGAPAGRRALFRDGRVTLARTVRFDGEPIGTVYLVADTQEWAAARRTFVLLLLALFVAVLVVGFLVSVGLQRLVTRPIQELARLMRRIGFTRAYELRAIKRGNDEIGVLVDGFNGMLDEISRRRAETERAQQELRSRVVELDAEIAERRRAEAELHRSRDHLRSFVENANIGLHWVAPDGTIIWANRHEMQMLGYTAEEYIGRNIVGFHVDHPVIENALARLARGETVDGEEARLRCKDGTIRYVVVNSSGYWEDGNFLHSRCFTRDITERKHAEDALRCSEARYRTLVAATTSVVFSTDAAGRVIERLPSWEAYTGQRWEEYAGNGWVTMVQHADRPRLKAAWLRTARRGEMFEVEARVWHARSRRYRYCFARAVPQRQADGPIYEWIGTMMDIDDRKRAEEQFRQAVEGAPNAMIMIDRAGRIVLVNRQIEAIFGYRRHELLGQPVERLVPETVREAHPRNRAEFFADPNARPMGAGRDLYGRHKTGRRVPIEIGLSPFVTEEDVFCLASIIDVTERRRAEERLRHYNEELERSNRELGQFAYVASHDLQEPLRAISGCAQLLAQRYRDKLDARANDLIEHTVGGAQRMQALINDLLSYSRLSTRARPFETCDLGQPVRRALANLEVAINEAGADVTMDALPVASVDPMQVTQLFQNLIGNALKFRAQRLPRIHVGVHHRSGGHLFYVEDNGIGIEPQYIERIFGVFQRLHNRSKYPGNGIGLAICRKIVERHHGRIWVESVTGRGSTFYFTLPPGNVHNEAPHIERYSSQSR